jgi:hypothetical protein
MEGEGPIHYAASRILCRHAPLGIKFALAREQRPPGRYQGPSSFRVESNADNSRW